MCFGPTRFVRVMMCFSWVMWAMWAVWPMCMMVSVMFVVMLSVLDVMRLVLVPRVWVMLSVEWLRESTFYCVERLNDHRWRARLYSIVKLVSLLVSLSETAVTRELFIV